MTPTKSSTEKLVLGLRLFLAKNRDLITVKDANLLTETIVYLENLNYSKSSRDDPNIVAKVSQIFIRLLKFFYDYELLKDLISKL